MTSPTTPEDTEAEFARLLWVLRNGRGFGLYFVCCNSPLYRQELIDRIKTEYAQPILEFDLTGHDFEEYIDHRLLTWAKDQPAGAPVFLYGLETLLPTRDEDRQFRTLQEINWRRNVYDKLGRNLVIWLPEYALVLLARQASDFYDWHSAVFEFPLPEAEKAGWVEQSLRGFTEGKTHASNKLTLAEKQRWLSVLNGLLDETPTDSVEYANLLNDLGRLNLSLADYDEALRCHKQSLLLFRALNDLAGEGVALNNISLIYHAQNDYKKAITYLEDALKICRDIGDLAGEGATTNNISTIYLAKGDYDKSLSYLNNSLAIRRDIMDRGGEGVTLNNISIIYLNKGDYDKALKYLEDALLIRREIGDLAGESTTLNNISQIYHVKGDDDKALGYLEEAIEIDRGLGNRAELCTSLFNIGVIQFRQGNQAEAEHAWQEAYRIAKEIGLAKALQALDKLAKDLGHEGLEYWEAKAEP